MGSETSNLIEMKIHEILAILPPDARKLFESLRAERKSGNTTNTLEGLLEQFDGDIHAVLTALDIQVPVTLFYARWQTETHSDVVSLSTEVHMTMPLSSKMALALEYITSPEEERIEIINIEDFRHFIELLLDKAVSNRNELADLRGCSAVWINIIGKAIAAHSLPNQSWDLEKGKRMSEDELDACKKVFAFITYLCDKARLNEKNVIIGKK